jgi:hypothetical protein
VNHSGGHDWSCLGNNTHARARGATSQAAIRIFRAFRVISHQSTANAIERLGARFAQYSSFSDPG